MKDYELHRTSDQNYDLVDPDGNTIESYEPPISGVKETLLPAVMDDLGMTDSEMRAAIMFAVTGEIDVIDDRHSDQ